MTTLSETLEDRGDSLGDRMKRIEATECDRRFAPMLPVYARIDGRGFSSFTRGMDRPFDKGMSDLMIQTTSALVEETHARIGYTQSDEISLVWLAERPESSIFFDHRVTKMTSVLASFATAAFTAALYQSPLLEFASRLPHFDCRVFQLPNREEAANMFLWREQDATKNAISSAARSVHSHNQLKNKTGPEMLEMLSVQGIEFDGYPAFFRRGTFVRRETVWREFTDLEIERIPPAHRPSPGTKVQRSVIRIMDMPRFVTVTNRADVIFDGAEPMVAGRSP